MTPPAPARTHIWDGTHTLPDWLTGHHWTAGQLVIHTPDGDTRPQAGWWLIRWTDDLVTTASPAVAERVYGNDGLWGRLQRAEHEIAQHTEAEAADIAAGSYAGRAETAERGLSRLLDLVRDFLDDSVCDLDAYGYCVAHSWACSGVRCPHARARDVLAALDGQQQTDAGPEPEDLTGAYTPDPPIGCLTPAPAWTPPPPGDKREQLPDTMLALIRDQMPDYLSTACQTADTLGLAACYPGSGVPRPEYDEIREHAERLHDRCRINQKFTGQLCACGCHAGAEQPGPAATEPRLAQDGVDTPGCTCGHTGMGVSWHGDDCLWRRGVVDCPGRPAPG